MISSGLLLETIMLVYEFSIWYLDLVYYQKKRNIASLKIPIEFNCKNIKFMYNSEKPD